MFRVLERNLPAVRAEIARLARRAERLGTAPLTLRETGERDGEHVYVALEGEPPTLAGWTVAAVVDHRPPVPALRVVSAAAPPLDRERFREPRCDHCRRRRRRVETFVLWHARDRARAAGRQRMPARLRRRRGRRAGVPPGRVRAARQAVAA